MQSIFQNTCFQEILGHVFRFNMILTICLPFAPLNVTSEFAVTIFEPHFLATVELFIAYFNQKLQIIVLSIHRCSYSHNLTWLTWLEDFSFCYHPPT